MQTKGFIKVITVALILVCIFYLSFSFVTSHYENIAEKKALAAAGLTSPDTSNDTYNSIYKGYLDSIGDKKVWCGTYTFNECREKEIGLGLDLKGGMNVTLQISVPDILTALASNPQDPKFLQALKEVSANSRAQQDYVASFCERYKELAPEAKLSQVFRKVQAVKDKPDATDQQVEQMLQKEVNSMVDNSYTVLRNRIDGLGVVAPNIQKLQSTGRILIELPGIKEPERVSKLLQGTANLEFYETYTGSEIQGDLAEIANLTSGNNAQETAAATDTAATDSTKATAAAATTAKAEQAKAKTPSKAKTLASYLQLQPGPSCVVGYATDTAAVNRILFTHDALGKRIFSPAVQSKVRNDLKLCWDAKPEQGTNGQPVFALYALKLVQGKPVLTGDVIDDASSDVDNLQGNVVSMTMNDDGARAWSRITGQNIGKAIAIVLDDQVYSAPNVNTKIDGGRSQITGRFTMEEAKDLANVLKSGKMVARVTIASQSVIGPSLGQEAINKGMLSFVIALVLLMIFMMSVYGVYAGNIANLGLLLNLFFTAGILASFQAVLTLPGIAGIVLALGMAVDANVLIFERCKEELRAGKNLKGAIADGYKNAFSAIFDSNLTSIITGAILAMLGTGPIKGFAITLIIGICCSFFTAVFVTRLVLEYFVNKGTFSKMTFTTNWSKDLMQNVHFDFMGKAKKVRYIVLAFILVVIAAFATLHLSLGIDFSGGRNFVVQFPHAVSTVDLQQRLTPLMPGANVSVITIDNNTKVRVSTNYKIDDSSNDVDDEIMHKLYDAFKNEFDGGKISYRDFSVSNENIGVQSVDEVGPSIASDMARSATWAVVFSLLAMALYILLRFRNVAFSLGALAAVSFSAFAVIGFYTLHGILPFSMEIDQTFIAAILTVIGYQVNDTVVVFDRVREYRTLFPKQDQYITFNNALCSTLARTTMTSLTTLLVLLVMFFLGGESIRSFIFAMILGVVIGTLSSLFIASPVAFSITKRQMKRSEKALATKLNSKR